MLIGKSLKPKSKPKKQRMKKVANLILGVVAIVVCIPFIVVLVFASLIVPQKKWEEFWDLF